MGSQVKPEAETNGHAVGGGKPEEKKPAMASAKLVSRDGSGFAEQKPQVKAEVKTELKAEADDDQHTNPAGGAENNTSLNCNAATAAKAERQVKFEMGVSESEGDDSGGVEADGNADADADATAGEEYDPLLTREMLEEERRLEEEREKEVEEEDEAVIKEHVKNLVSGGSGSSSGNGVAAAADADGGGSSAGNGAVAAAVAQAAAGRPLVRSMGEQSFSKLDMLLEKTKAYSQFLLDNMDDLITMPKKADGAGKADEEGGGKKGRKRKQQPAKGRGRTGKKAKGDEPSLAAKISSAEEKKEETEFGDRKEEEEDEDEAEEALMRAQQQIAPNLQNCVLKWYQVKGVKWLISLWQNGLNGILADQMGLGKTVQTISFLAHLKSRGMHGPYIVVAPLSTLSNWVNEFTRFLPSAKVLLYHGTREEREALRSEHLAGPVDETWPIVVTSFEVVLRDRRKLKWRWKYLVVDEGHRLKNFDCKLIRELRQMDVENTLLLTGTPLQNNLQELWSLLNFLLPDIFSDLSEFTAWFDLEGRTQRLGLDSEQQQVLDKEKRAKVVSKLHTILQPFLLRRVKADVERSLPRKKEIVLYARMAKDQEEFRDHLVKRTLEDFLNETRAPVISRTKLNNVMMQLRKNCNHPDLLSSVFDGSFVYPPVEELLGQCGKLQLLNRLLTHLKKRGHKMIQPAVLVFSQMTRMLDILDYFCEQQGWRACRIDGSIHLAQRREQIAAFNSDPELFVFLLSTRAGGLGINLTAADTVVIYDSDWNPHMDMQAMDRCHRIGQTRPVHVYRLITAHSVECRMMEVATRKLNLEHLVIEKGQFLQERPSQAKPAKVDEAEVLALLRPQQSAHDEMVQSAEISEENLELLLDRSDLVRQQQRESLGKKTGDAPSVSQAAAAEEGGSHAEPKVLPLAGPGWQVVTMASAQNDGLASIK